MVNLQVIYPFPLTVASSTYFLYILLFWDDFFIFKGWFFTIQGKVPLAWELKNITWQQVVASEWTEAHGNQKKLNTLLPIMVDKPNEEEKVEGLVALVILSVVILQQKDRLE